MIKALDGSSSSSDEEPKPPPPPREPEPIERPPTPPLEPIDGGEQDVPPFPDGETLREDSVRAAQATFDASFLNGIAWAKKHDLPLEIPGHGARIIWTQG